MFKEWLETHVPLKAKHIMNRMKDIRSGRENDPRFKSRMRGEGVYAEIISQRFKRSCEQLGLNKMHIALDTKKFKLPLKRGDQIRLF